MRRLTAIVLVLAAVIIGARRLVAPGHKLIPAWTDRTGIEFHLVQPGTFRMGTPPAEQGREPQEVLHEVRLTKPFYLGRYEVTQAQWTKVMGGNPSRFAGCERCPVERVSFDDVQEFINRLNKRDGGGFRLPTEAEWEYSCRAGGDQPFGHSDSLTSRDANIDGRFPYNGPKGGAREETIAGGHFPANPWGFYDMSGNVWEWVQDPYCPYPGGSVTDPIATCASDLRVIRGGSWHFDGASARCGLRYTHRPQDSGYSLGFRLAHDGW